MAWTRFQVSAAALLFSLTTAACGKDGPIIYDGNPGSGGEIDANVAIDADTAAPDTVLDSTPAAATNATAAAFAFHADDASATFRCTLDGVEADCASPASYTVAEGAHAFAVAAIDGAGNRDASPATFAWTVDTTPPDTTITVAPPALDNSTSVSFEFTSEPGATFECSDDGGAFAPCATPHPMTGLADGAHTFDVRAIDAVGNVDPTPAHHAWTIDSSTPDTQIDSGPTGVVNLATAVFAFSSPDAGAGATFKCSLDGAPETACTSPITYASLGETPAPHVFAVRVADQVGNVDPTPATRSWTVDLSAPVVTITSGPSGPTNVAAPSFAFTATGSPTSVQCHVDGGALAACTSPFTSAALADGPHAFEVVATDAAGNVGSASRAFSVDTVAPTVTITGGPIGPTSDATPTFTFTAAGAPTLVQCAIDNAVFVACSATFTPAALPDGAHEFDVRAVDAAGNVGAATRAFALDTVAPTATITGGPSGLTNNATPTFTFVTGGSPTTTQCRIGGGAFTACTGSFTPAAALADGAYTFEVQVSDAAGNSSSATRSFTVDATPPTVTITSGPSGLTNDATPTFTFTTGGNPTTTQCRLDGGAYAACAATFTAAALADGAHTFDVQVIDAATNSATASRAFTTDATPPTVTITSGPSGLTNDATPTFTFTTGGNPTTTQCRLDGGAYAACAATFTSASLADGAHTFDVQVIDAATNSATASRAFTIDATPPTVTITGGPTGLTSDSTPTFTFTTGGNPTTTQCRLDNNAYASCAATFTAPALADGAHTFDVQVIDAATNTATASRAFSIDATAPTVTITGGPTGLTNNNTPTFTFTTGGNPTTTQCRIGTGAFASCTASFTPSTALADGSYTFEVDVADAAGNTASATRAFTVDATAPTVTITGGPTGLTNDSTPTFTFTTAGSPTTTQCRIGTGAFTACNASFTPSPALTDGSYVFEVQVADAAGNSSNATRAFSVDATPPTVTITGGPTGLTNNNVPTFSFTTGGSPTTTQCRINTSPYAACFATFTPPALADGSYTFEVQVIDAAGNSANATRSFSVDATPPTVTITGGPSGTTSNNTPTFTFTTGGNPTTTQCRIGTGTFASCAASFTPSSPLADGSYTFDVQVIDAAGNTADATRSFTVDTKVTITGSVSPAAAAALTATANSATCPGGACLVLPGTKVHLALAPLPGWSFSGWTGAGAGCTGTALAIDVTAGTVSSSCTANFAQLTVALTAQPDPIAAPTSSHFAWTKSAAVTSSYCSLDGSTFAFCNGATTEDYTYMGPGTHTFALYGADGAGAKSATVSYAWTQHVDDGHIVLVGHDFHNVVAPYTYGSGTAQSLLLSAIKLGRYSPVTNNYEVLIYSKSTTPLGTSEVANIKAAALAGSGAVHFTDLTATDGASLTTALIGKSVFVIPDQTDHGAAALAGAWTRPLADFVTRGGVLIVLTGLDAAGNPDDTGAVLAQTGLMDVGGTVATNGGDNTFWPLQDSPVAWGLTQGSYSLAGSVQFYSDGRVVSIAPFRSCTNGVCARANQVVAHKTVHTIEGFDYAHASWPWSPWTAATANLISRDTANAHDETTGATGQGNALNAVSWATRGDVAPVIGSTVSTWVRFSQPPSGAAYGGLGLGTDQGLTSACVVIAFAGQMWLEPGRMTFGGSFTPDVSYKATPTAVTWGAWYQLRIGNNGASTTTTLYDAAGNLLQTATSAANPPSSRGVAIGVSANATIDSVTIADALEIGALFGTDTTTSANTSFDTICPDGEVMVGARGQAAEAIDDFAALHCARIVPDTTHASGYHLLSAGDSLGQGGGNPSGGGAWDETCPGDGIVTAISTGVGTANGYTSLYAIQLLCTTFTLTGGPGTYALTPGAVTSLPQVGTGHSGVPLTWSAYFGDNGVHALTGFVGYYGPWPIYAGFVVVNGIQPYADRPWISY